MWNRHSKYYPSILAQIVFGLVTLSIVVTTHADTKVPENLQVHGFLSQGYLLTSGNKVFGNSKDNGSFGFREIGLNASLQPMPSLQLSAQLLSRHAGKGNNGGIRVDYGFADYRISSDVTKQFGIRLGRVKNPFGFYNETRDVPFTRPSILLPQSIYFDRTRNLALAGDGAQLYGEANTNFGDFSIQFQTGLPQVNDKNSEVALIGGNFPGKLQSRLSYIGRIIYELDGGRLRLAVSGSQLNVGYDPAAPFGADLMAGLVRFSPIIFSAQYNAERFSITSEYAIRPFRIKDFGVSALDLNFIGESYYIQGAYRFNQEWEGFLRYDVLFTDRNDRNGRQFRTSTGRPAHNRFAKDMTVGLRWSITPEIMLRAEYHRIDGTAWLSTLDNPDHFNTNRHWNLFAAQISYRF